MPEIQDAQYYELGSPEHLNGQAKNLWASPMEYNIKPKISTMPFEITQFQNGLEICELILQHPQNPIPLDKWLEKLITKHPTNISIIDLIRTVADRGGGAHIHPKFDNFLNMLKTSTPCKMGYDVLFTIAIGRFAQQIGFMVVQFYEKIGSKGDISDLMKIFDQNHPSISSSAKVPIELINKIHTKFSLQSVQYAKAIWIDRV